MFDLRQKLEEMMGIKQPQGRKAPAPTRAAPGPIQAQPRNAPAAFKMYEDNSFQGDPKQFASQNPGYRFFEDNSFSGPKLRMGQPQMNRGASFNGIQRSTSRDETLQNNFVDAQGDTNPGYIPLQNSGIGGLGYTSNLQPADDLRRRLRY